MKQAPLNNLKIGIDLMGSDTAPSILLEAICQFSKNCKGIDFVVIGTEEVESVFLELKETYHLQNVSLLIVKNSISLNENPLVAVRRKKDSSICEGLNLLKHKKIDAFVSAGNTGAITTAAKMLLDMLPNTTRPALLAVLPTKKNPLAILDVGANVTHKAENLVQFAMMGIAFQNTRGITKPIVGLLNIGSEEKKGTVEIRKAYQELQKKSLLNNNFIFAGNIEGKEVFEGSIDVLVTDGFTGNVFLKTAEGTASFILQHFYSQMPEKDPAIKTFLADLENRLHYTEYPGAILCGVDGIVIKCHSYSTTVEIVSGIKGAINLVESNFLERLKTFLKNP